MLITNEFIIERYLGSEPLPLLSAPSNLSGPLLAQYNTFISNIVAIYGSQDEQGNIPVFFKDSDGEPSSGSSLTVLESGQEYNFLSKTTANFPYNIPALGTTITPPGPTVCPTFPPCCPVIEFDNSLISLSDGNMYTPISAEVSGLNPNTSYTYSFSGLGANWPSRISPLSGVLNPVSTVDTIDGMFNFYATTGNRPDSLAYSLDGDPNKDNYIWNNIYSILQLKLVPSDNDCSPVSDRVTVRCSGCVPSPPVPPDYRPTPVFIGATAGNIALNAGCCDKPVPISVQINNIKIGENYTYAFTVWPTNVAITPSGGTVGFGENTGKISALIDMNTEETAIIRCSVTDPVTNKVYVDFVGMKCGSSC